MKKILVVFGLLIGFGINANAQFFETLGKIIQTTKEVKSTVDDWSSSSSNSSSSRNNDYTYERSITAVAFINVGTSGHGKTTTSAEVYSTTSGSYKVKSGSSYYNQYENYSYDSYSSDSSSPSYYRYYFEKGGKRYYYN